MALHRIGTRLGAACLALALASVGAAAHHGWSWATTEQTELRGTVREVYVGPPHPTLRVQAADGGLWTIELGNPRQTASAGFSAESASVGETVTALGNRSLNPEERRLKAVRITVRDRTYDIYPDRIRGS